MNTKILLRTITDPEGLQLDLKAEHFEHQLNETTLEVEVFYSDLQKFGEIVKKNFNAPYNYTNVKFPTEKINILIFPNRDFLIKDLESDKKAKEWAISIGLPGAEAEWTTFY